MRLSEKLSRLLDRKGPGAKAEVARASGIAATMLSSYIHRGSLPRADVALKLARALEVPLEWLVDEAQDFPAPEVDRVGPEHATDDELMRELGRRLRREAINASIVFDEIKRTNWKKAADDLDRELKSEELSDEAGLPYELAAFLLPMVSNLRYRFDANQWCQLHHESLPGANSFTPEQLDVHNLYDRIKAWSESTPSYLAYRPLVNARMSITGGMDDLDSYIEKLRERSREMFKGIDG